MDETQDCGCSDWTDRTIAIIGMAIGIGAVLMAADLLTNGWITRAIVPARKLAAVIDFPNGDADAAS